MRSYPAAISRSAFVQPEIDTHSKDLEVTRTVEAPPAHYAGQDDEAVALCAADDFAAFAQLYNRFQCAIFRYLRARTPDDDVAEDLTAQVFFNALSRARSFRGDGTYRSWLFTIASNQLATWCSRRASIEHVREIPDVEDPAASPDVLAVGRERDAIVRAAIEDLTPDQHEAVTLRYLRDLSIEEVALATRRSRGAVRILLHRAREHLRRRLEELAL